MTNTDTLTLQIMESFIRLSDDEQRIVLRIAEDMKNGKLDNKRLKNNSDISELIQEYQQESRTNGKKGLSVNC